MHGTSLLVLSSSGTFSSQSLVLSFGKDFFGGDFEGVRVPPLASFLRKGMLLASEDWLEKGPEDREVDVESEREMLEFELVWVGEETSAGRDG